MFDPNTLTISNMRYEEMRHNVRYEHLLQWPMERAPFYQRFLLGVGHRMVAWGTFLQDHYGNGHKEMHWTGASRRMERAL